MGEFVAEYSDVLRSWQDHCFKFNIAVPQTNTPGLRKPQLAAIYATLGHLVIDPSTPATVVMPTGTGKTDTMLALLISGKMERTLILVPSDALRSQLVGKCSNLKTLRSVGAVSDVALNPVVAAISSGMSEKEVLMLSEANVIVATPQALRLFDGEAVKALGGMCSHLFIDEAHHVPANSWDRVKNIFKGKPCIQFTATPFREDGLALEGKIIYNYPLKDAQDDGYFKNIEFHPVREYNLDLSDQAIADKAVELLRKDIDAGYNHLMLVRAKSQKRAESLFEIYSSYTDLSSILMHSKVPNQTKVFEEIVQKKYRIIVCVDMLGEGFDLPELKIAAIHDQHKSPAVTLQFIGRLTRVDDTLGDAKFVANIANQKTDHQMSDLYKESADWGKVIRDVSQEKVSFEIEKEVFNEQFSDDTESDSIFGLNPNPKVSAMAYHLSPKNWQPAKARNFNGRRENLKHISINDDADTIIMVTRRETLVGWAQTEAIVDTNWVLYLAFYNEPENTLFVHTSGDDTQATQFLKLIAKDAVRINGEPTFRSLHNIKLMKLQNVGLSRARKDLRFTMHVGHDINQVISDIEKGNAKKSNIFATGFELGERTTVGCSHKGKIWEMNSSPINYWIKWCKRISTKLNDQSIDPGDVLKNVMRAEKIENKWPAGLFYCDWPETIAIENEQKISLIFQGERYNLLDIVLGRPSNNDDLTLRIPVLTVDNDGLEQHLTNIYIKLLADGYKTHCPDLKIVFSQEMPLDEYLDGEALVLLSVDGAMLHGNYRYFSPNGVNVKLPKALLETWDWGTTKIYQESMRAEKRLDSVQGFTYQKIADDFGIVFNDDGAGEIADLVAIRVNKDRIYISLFHCKYCPLTDGAAIPGARLSDVYEVCGQASRSVKWLYTGEKFFDRLLERYQKSLSIGFDRILKGTPLQLEILRNKCHDHELVFNFVIVQPAVSAKKLSEEQLTVLGTSYSYIKSISGSDIKVIISP
ncbi:DEAD/DEAH box helicase [Yersinia sp. 22-579]|uniref:DEAD/DEAH box helicase n=1 Tax=Yersinia sp. 22-579 TaxID=3057580 RepID=UPI00263B7669|nr:DEAD/DEAH box helicase family protein [Yersinia sp. 22-579]